MILILVLSLIFGFDSNAATLPDDPADTIQVTTIDEISDSEESTEVITEESMEESTESNEFDILKDYGLGNLISFKYIRDLPDRVSQADLYILLCRIYNLALLSVWTFIAFNVIDLISRSVGRLKRKN